MGSYPTFYLCTIFDHILYTLNIVSIRINDRDDHMPQDHGMSAPNNTMSVIPPGIPAFLNGPNIYGNINMSFNTYSCNQTHL